MSLKEIEDFDELLSPTATSFLLVQTDGVTQKLKVSSISSSGAGGGMSFPFTYSTTTADADPGAGTFRGNNASLGSSTQLFFDDLEYNGTTVSSWFASFDDAVSSGKGTLRLQSVADPTKWLEFPVTAYTSATGYSKITVGTSRGPGGIATTVGDTTVIFDAGATGTVTGAAVTTESTTSRTFGLADVGAYIRTTNGSATSLTVPPNSATAFAIGSEIEGIQAGAGQITFVQGSGVTINKPASRNLKTAEQYSSWSLKKVDTDTWDLCGDLEIA